MRKLWFVMLVGAGMLAGATAHSQTGPICASSSGIYQWLADTYGEERIMFGARSDSVVYELWASREKLTWSWVQTTSGGQSCVVMSGNDYMYFAPRPNI